MTKNTYDPFIMLSLHSSRKKVAKISSLPSSGLLRSVRRFGTEVSGLPIGPETSISNHLTLLNNTEDGRLHFNRGGILRSWKVRIGPTKMSVHLSKCQIPNSAVNGQLYFFTRSWTYVESVLILTLQETVLKFSYSSWLPAYFWLRCGRLNCNQVNTG